MKIPFKALNSKKVLLILTPISSLLLIFSFMIYSSTFNTVAQRVDVQNIPISLETTVPDDENFWSVSDSVYGDIYNINKPNSFLSPSTNMFIEEPDKIVYLTIDDGPDPKSTSRYLEVLRRYNIKATFFMIGATMERYPQLVKDIHSEGHAIGNHSYTHNYGSLYKDTESLANEIFKTEEVIYSLTGERSRIFRAPGGSPNMKKAELVDKLNEIDYVYFDWNVTAADTAPNGITKNQVVYNLTQQSKGLKKVVALMHDNHKRMASVEALPEVIEWFKERGYVFGTLNEFIEPVHIKWSPRKTPSKQTVTQAIYQF